MMTSKRQSDDKAWHAGRSEPNLGQKEAALEKAMQGHMVAHAVLIGTYQKEKKR